MNTIEETAETMFGHKKYSIQSMLMSFREIKCIVDNFKRSADDSKLNDFNFSGQHTDIAFVDVNGTLNTDVINNIKDNDIRNAVMQNFSEAVKDGYLKCEDGIYSLTDKGKEHINSDSFKEQFKKDQLNAMSKNKAKINLTGKQSDLNVFRYVDNINLNHLYYDNPAAFKKILSYFEQCQKYDFVKISSDGTVTPTEKCLQYLKQNKDFKFDIQKITPDNIEDIAKNVSKTVKSSSREASKKAAQEAAKRAAQETAKAAANTSAKAAAAAGSGATTAGIGTAVTAVVDLAEKGIKTLGKATELHLRTPNHHN